MPSCPASVDAVAYRAQARGHLWIRNRSRPSAVTNGHELSVPAGGWHPDLDFDVGVSRGLHAENDAAESGKILGATARRPAGGGNSAFVIGAGSPGAVGAGAAGSLKAPAATVCASVIVVSGRVSEARLSHELRAADSWLKGTASIRTAGNATPAIFMVNPAGKEQTAEVPRSVPGYARRTSLPYGPVNWAEIEALPGTKRRCRRLIPGVGRAANHVHFTRFSIGGVPSGSVGEIDGAAIGKQTVHGRKCATTLLAEGDGQRNRRLVAFSFRFLNRSIEKRAECAQECAQTRVPKRVARRRYKALLWLRLASKGDGLNEGSPSPLALRTFPCKCLGHVYLQVRGEVAER